MAAPPLAIPGYRILRSLGQGGMGAVYLVEPEGVAGATRALKVLPAQDDTRRARFQREAELLARVEGHPSLARVHAAGEHRGQPWIVMEFVEGEDLHRLTLRRGPAPWPVALERVARVAEGLARVHALGVLHRDIKPANIIVERPDTDRERVVLIDFGVATAVDLERLTRTGEVVGTPQYMSPEAARGQPLDARSDVYALGATLFELLTGQPLFDGETLGAVFAEVLAGSPRAPSAEVAGIPPGVDALVLRAVAKEPARRPQDAAAFAAELRELLARPPGRSWRRPVRAAALAATLGVVLVLVLVGWPTAPPPAPPRAAPATPPAASEPPRPSAAAPLLDAIVTGSAEALRAARRPGAPLAHEAVEAQLRAAALAEARARPVDVKRLEEWLEALGLVREAYTRSGERPPGDDRAVADAALQAVDSLLPDLARPDRAIEAGLRVVRIFRGVVASRRRPGDRVAAELLLERVGSRFFHSAFGGIVEKGPLELAYDEVLRASVDLDIDVDANQLRESPRDSAPKGHQAEVIRVRVALATSSRTSGAADELHTRNARRAIELEQELGDRLGPVVRARLLTAIPRGEDASVTLARLARARDLDPDSAAVRMVLAQVLRTMARPREAAAEARAALARRALRRSSDTLFRFGGVSDFHEACVQIFIEADALDEAQRLIDSFEDGFGREELQGRLDARRARQRGGGR